MDVVEKIGELISEAMPDINENIAEFSEEESESPIESLLAAAIVVDTLYSVSKLESQRVEFVSFVETTEDLEEYAVNRRGLIVIAKQVKVLSYRADMLAMQSVSMCEASMMSRLVIECDGHDWHERTKEQAAHDKRRDRRLLSSGYGVLRFTGSEVWNDAMGCVGEIIEYFDMKRHVSREVESAVNKYTAAMKHEWYNEGFADGARSASHAVSSGLSS